MHFVPAVWAQAQLYPLPIAYFHSYLNHVSLDHLLHLKDQFKAA